MFRAFFILAILVFNIVLLQAQPFTKKYIMSFHRCAIPNCGGPVSHTVQLAESNDAENWTLVPNFVPYTGSVPDVIVRGQVVYIYTPGSVKRYDQVSNTWDATPVPVSVADSIGNPVSFVDPSAVVDSNGRLVLFYLNSSGIVGDPAYCANPPCTSFFDSAEEVAGSNGTQFIAKPGHRATYTTQTNFKPTDPDVFFHNNTWYQYISYGTGTMVYECNQLHGTYIKNTSLPNGYLTANSAGIPCGLYQQTAGKIYSYGHGNTANGTCIFLAKHNDMLTQPVYNQVFSGTSIGLGNVQVASPGICVNTLLPNSMEGNSPTGVDIKLYPNPASSAFTIISKEDLRSARIFHTSGMCILTKKLDSPQNSIETANLSAGLYFVELITRDGMRIVRSILIQATNP